jgi:hypothetical protein
MRHGRIAGFAAQRAHCLPPFACHRPQGHALLARYLEWTPRADRFAPVLVETDFEVNVLDPAPPRFRPRGDG